MNDKDQYLLAIDSGTESLRVGIFDYSGKKINSASSGYPTFHPEASWAEQDPRDWEEALKKATIKVLDKVDIDPESIQAIVADATIGTVVPLDENQNPLQKAIMWMDVRASEEYEYLLELEHPSVKKMPTAEWVPCKLKWLKNNKPEIYRKTNTFVEQLDWINYALTGEVTHASANLTARWMFDEPGEKFPESLYSQYGIGEVSKKLSGRVLKPSEYIGGLNKELAEDFKIPADTPVFEGVPDGIAASIGVNALQDGDVMMIMGSSHCHLITLREGDYVDGIMGPFSDCPVRCRSLLEAGQTSTGSILRWLRKLAGKQGVEEFYEVMDKLADELPVGSEGLLLLDYFQGNRTPLRDPSARGTILGLSLNHELKHIYRSILEGVAYGTELILERFRDKDMPISKLIGCGGGASSDLWLSIHANVSDIEIVLPEELDASLLGCAVLGATGKGIYSSPFEAANKMVRYERSIKPSPSLTESYNFYYEKYKQAYKQNKKLLRDISSHSKMQSR